MKRNWTVFRAGEALVVAPKTPLLVKLRQTAPDDFLTQQELSALRSVFNWAFILGPVGVLASLYLPVGKLLTLGIGIGALFISAMYWFATYRSVSWYLGRLGYQAVGEVEAMTCEEARAAGAKL